jgi:dolichyl-phosphate-mannose-protein mannosyltransferase
VKLKNEGLKSYLHSQTIDSQDQQVIVSNKTDKDSDWIIHPTFIDVSVDSLNNVAYVVKHGDYVRIKHVSSGKFLTAHINASDSIQEASLRKIRNITTDEAQNDTYWIVLVQSGNIQLGVNASKFVLLHSLTEFPLLTSFEHPDWRSTNHLTVSTANISNYSNTSGAHWVIDSCKPPAGWEVSDVLNLENPEPIEIGFYDKFIELIEVALRINSQFSSEGNGHLAAEHWPLIDHPMVWWISKDRSGWVVLIGNPFAWYLSFLTLPAFIALMIVDVIRQRRGAVFLTKEQRSFLYSKGGFFLLCYLMTRILYFHHYMPGYLFSALVFTSLYQVLALKFRILETKTVVGVICVLSIGFFYVFSGLTYATPQSREELQKIAWREKWNFS